MTGLTSPTYTLTPDQPPDTNAKQFFVSALGGTQTGVTTHSTSSPFLVTQMKPKVPRVLGTPNPSTGVIPNIPYNKWKTKFTKGVIPALNQAALPAMVEVIISIPAGAELFDAPNVRALISFANGIGWDCALELEELVRTNTM